MPPSIKPSRVIGSFRNERLPFTRTSCAGNRPLPPSPVLASHESHEDRDIHGSEPVLLFQIGTLGVLGAALMATSLIPSRNTPKGGRRRKQPRENSSVGTLRKRKSRSKSTEERAKRSWGAFGINPRVESASSIKARSRRRFSRSNGEAKRAPGMGRSGGPDASRAICSRRESNSIQSSSPAVESGRSQAVQIADIHQRPQANGGHLFEGIGTKQILNRVQRYRIKFREIFLQ